MGLSQDFLEKVTLLVLTGGLSGFFIPYILKQVDERKLKDQKIIDARRLEEQKEFDARKLQEQKEFDASLVRENNVLEAQIKLLENLSEALWELQLLSLAVSYYKVHPNQERYEVALKNYDEKSWELFKDIRCEISKSTRLVSQKNYDKLLDFFDDNVIQRMDENLMHLIEIDASPEDWKRQYIWTLKNFPKQIDDVVKSLAKELRLASPKVLSNNSGAAD
jgi:membrane-associated HD superfamily phosphohydrolase